MKRPTARDTEHALAGGEVNLGDRTFRLVATLFGAGIVFVLAAMAVHMTRASALSLRRFGFGFLTSSEWDPVRDLYGGLPFVWGTVASSLLALVIAVPVALGVAVFLSELAPGWLRRIAGFTVELLAAIPSVVYGLWGIFVLAPWLRRTVEPALGDALGFLPFFQGPRHGFGLLAGGHILAIMILPTIASVSRDVMRAVPHTYPQGALPLG